MPLQVLNTKVLTNPIVSFSHLCTPMLVCTWHHDILHPPLRYAACDTSQSTLLPPAWASWVSASSHNSALGYTSPTLLCRLTTDTPLPFPSVPLWLPVPDHWITTEMPDPPFPREPCTYRGPWLYLPIRLRGRPCLSLPCVCEGNTELGMSSLRALALWTGQSNKQSFPWPPGMGR